MRHGCLATNLTCSLSRKRRGSGWVSRLLSMPSAAAVPAGPTGCRASDEDDGWREDGRQRLIAKVTGAFERYQLGLERSFDLPRIDFSQAVLGAKNPVRPDGGVIR